MGGTALATLQQIYGSIAPELERVEDRIRAALSSDHTYLNRLLKHLMKFAGKRIRPAVLLYSARMAGGIKDLHIILAAVIEILHNATLVHDDVLDGSQMRRNTPTINSAWDNEQAIIFGDYLFARAFQLCASLGHPEATQILADTSHRMCVGEMLQLSKKFATDMTEAEYLQIVELKTAALFEAACRYGALENPVGPEFVDALCRYGRALGIAFQVIDDCLDLVGEENVVGKSLGTDITKGKITLPVIRLLATLRNPERARLRRMLEAPDHHEEKRAEVKRLLLRHGIMDGCVAQARRYVEDAKAAVSKLTDSACLRNLQQIADFVIDRKR